MYHHNMHLRLWYSFDRLEMSYFWDNNYNNNNNNRIITFTRIKFSLKQTAEWGPGRRVTCRINRRPPQNLTRTLVCGVASVPCRYSGYGLGTVNMLATIVIELTKLYQAIAWHNNYAAEQIPKFLSPKLDSPENIFGLPIR